jgi:hypothetical protein
MTSRVRQVMKQTRARIFRGNTRSEDKLLSLFEPSTEVIRKGKAGKPNEFGKMVKVQEAENQIITDYEVYARRPVDSDLLVAAIEVHQALLGRTPNLVAADAAFYSARNETAAKEKGVRRVCPHNQSHAPAGRPGGFLPPRPRGASSAMGSAAGLVKRRCRPAQRHGWRQTRVAGLGLRTPRARRGSRTQPPD